MAIDSGLYICLATILYVITSDFWLDIALSLQLYIESWTHVIEF